MVLVTSSGLLLGALMNRWRGGLWSYGGTANAIVFAIMVTCLVGPMHGLVAILLMYAGQQPGWGRYIGALYGTEKEDLEEVWAIDWIIKPFVTHMRIWGFAGLALRGLYWTSLLAIINHNYLYAAIGLLMPICYLLPKLYLKNDGTAWQHGEIIFGALIWGGFVYAL